MTVRPERGGVLLVAVLTGLALVGCGDGAEPVDAVEDTDEDEDTSTGMGTTGASSGTSDGSTTGDGTTGEDPNDPDGSTGEPDDGSTGGDDPPPVDSDLDLESYRITWTTFESQVTRMYTAAGDFSGIVALTPDGTDSVALEEFQDRPKMHASGRVLAFIRDGALHTADVLAGQTHALTNDGVAVRRFAWAPQAQELAWIDDNLRFQRADHDANTPSLIRSLQDDGLAPDAIQFTWGPMGDRFWGRSRPNGIADTLLWAIDSDGGDYGVVAQVNGATVTHAMWTPPGDQMTMIANLDAGTFGREMYIGERDGVQMVSHVEGGVSKATISKDGSRIVYVADDGLFSLASDGTGVTLIDGGTPESSDDITLWISDDGSIAAWVSAAGELVVTSTTAQTPLQLEPEGVHYRDVVFVPGGTRIAYIKDETENGGQRELWMVDGDGKHLMNHDLPDGSNVTTFEWFQGGLLYTVVDADERPVLHHTDLGETPLFIPTPTEWSIRAYPSPDENLLVIRPTDIDYENGRLCAFDVSDVTHRIALGCEDIHIDYTISVFVTQPE